MYELHQLCELFPPATAEEQAELKADIKANGLRSKIVLFEEKILDGRGRYSACLELGRSPDMRPFDPATEGSPLDFVVSMNLRRRHLTTAQRADLADKLKPMFEDEGELNRLANLKRGGAAPDAANLTPSGKNGRSLAKAAKATGVSESSAKAFGRLKKRDPALAARVVAGELSINAAQKILKERESQRSDSAPPANGQKVEMGSGLPPQKDALGVPIPRCIEKAFDATTTFEAVLNLLRNLTAHMNKAVGKTGLERRPGFELLLPQAQEMIINLKNVRNFWTFAKPYAVCPDCNASGRDCHPCGSRGWIEKDKYERNFRKRDSQPDQAVAVHTTQTQADDNT